MLKNKWTELKQLLQNDCIKWVNEDTIHLTLFFIGETRTTQIDEIATRLEHGLIKTSSFKIVLKGITYFGNSSSIKVIWAGISESFQLLELKEVIDNALISVGYEKPAGKFTPHITLGRAKQANLSHGFHNFNKSNRDLIIQENVIDRVIFYQSILKPSGPTYKPLKEIKLLSL